jgi:hypothetical protein
VSWCTLLAWPGAAFVLAAVSDGTTHAADVPAEKVVYDFEDPATTVADALGRPAPVAGDGRVQPELLG